MLKLKYRLCDTVNIGADDSPYMIETFVERVDDWSEAAEEAVKTKAYNGEYTIEDDGQPEPEPTEQEQLRADVDFLLAMGGVL